MAEHLPDLAQETWETFLNGYVVGYRHGLDAGREHERDELEEMGRTAARIVHRMAEIPPRDRAADEARAAQSRAWWRRRRGEASS